ncbi:Phosphoribosylformylglycinamidine synthase, partial [Armadillidium nasatum]
IYKKLGEENVEVGRKLKLLNSSGNNVKTIAIETCFYIQLKGRDIEEEDLKVLNRIIGDPWQDEFGLSQESQFCTSEISNKNQILVEIGPRLNFSTPWSSNCISICKAAGLEFIDRMEKASRYLITFTDSVNEKNKSKIISQLYDPMTQQIYEKPLERLSVENVPKTWTIVDVIGEGRKALEEINTSMGLAFDEWDLDYYTNLFREKINRNPTTVELFDLAQSNSEHSRHWFFKGEYELDGEKLPTSLLQMVIDTNNEQTTNQNNIIKFTDNSSGIKGWHIPVLIPRNPKIWSDYRISECLRHIIFTAETHNFPTGVSPFSGATTGTGGRIRDVQSAGKGGHVIAGTAGYCFGNLHIPGYNLEWEEPTVYPSNFAKPLEVVIEASNGASDYGNKFGEPVICGFSRSFGMFIAQLVVKIGGPVYRIGVGGGAASSVQVQGDNSASRDLGAVQRGDAEMEQKLNRVIRSCLELASNPILAIHDQGAGGNANVLKELMEGSGGTVFTKAFTLGDPTLSTLEIWGAEYQESNALLVKPSDFEELEQICKRERCPVDKVGIITNDHKVRLYETEFEERKIEKIDENLPVNLDLDWVLGKMPRKVFKWTKIKYSPKTLILPPGENVKSALKRVLRLPSVASKRYLTNKVDRSVTGLVAQQQCVGFLQMPISDVAVTALSYFSKKGVATSIGEQPTKILINPCAGARMTVLESLTNLSACLISDIKDIKCSANWMWPAKLIGEGYALYEACQSMCEIMKQLGIAVDGGKDSLSMAARVSSPSNPSESTIVKAPGALVISAYAPCPDITKVATPDLKSPLNGTVGNLILIKPAFDCFRLGGSALTQVYSQTGSECPDVTPDETNRFIVCFKAIQQLIQENLILSIHDISDGGLITCLIEMSIGGWGGIEVHIPFQNKSSVSPEYLPLFSEVFNEEIGWVIEVDKSTLQKVMNTFHKLNLNKEILLLGHTTDLGPDAYIKCFVNEKEVVSLSIAEATEMWEETSFQLESLQMNPDLAREEFESMLKRKPTKDIINFKWNKNSFNDPLHRHPQTPKMAIIREEGSNGDRELAAAFIQAGFIVYDVTMSDLISQNVNLNEFRGLAFPGGFSYADVLGSGVGWAASIKARKVIRKSLKEWSRKRSTFSLGICNGCQLLALLGWIDANNGTPPPTVKLCPNNSSRFESRWSRVKIKKSNSVLLRGMENSVLGIWVAHGEGKFQYRTEDVKGAIENNNCIALQYVDDDNNPTEKYPFNPNGSSTVDFHQINIFFHYLKDGVAGLSSVCGRHLAMMPHPERSILSWQCPYNTYEDSKESSIAPWSKMFQNAFDWCLKTDPKE